MKIIVISEFDCIIYLDSLQIGVCSKGETFSLELEKGRHVLSFENKENKFIFPREDKLIFVDENTLVSTTYYKLSLSNNKIIIYKSNNIQKENGNDKKYANLIDGKTDKELLEILNERYKYEYDYIYEIITELNKRGVEVDIPQQMENRLSKEEVYNYVAKRMIEDEISADIVKNELTNKGVYLDYANKVVDEIDIAIKEERVKKAKKDMLYGALWCIGGLVVTAISYNSASEGGSYRIFWGAVVFGGYQFIKGLINL